MALLKAVETETQGHTACPGPGVELDGLAWQPEELDRKSIFKVEKH